MKDFIETLRLNAKLLYSERMIFTKKFSKIKLSDAFWIWVSKIGPSKVDCALELVLCGS